MEIIGRLTRKFDTTAVSDKFKRREFVLTTEEDTPYPQEVLMQLAQMNCEKLDPYNEDDVIKAHFNIRGRRWDGPQGVKWFNTLDVWRVELVEKGSGQQAKRVRDEQNAHHISRSDEGVKPNPPSAQINDQFDDLPF